MCIKLNERRNMKTSCGKTSRCKSLKTKQNKKCKSNRTKLECEGPDPNSSDCVSG